jgi:hypothetical protein
VITTGSAMCRPSFYFGVWVLRHRGSSGWLHAMNNSATKVELAAGAAAGREDAIDEDYDAVL